MEESRGMKRMAIMAAASLLAAFGMSTATTGVASAKGGYGLVTFDGVGPLSGGTQPVEFDALPADLRAFAGRPDSVSVLSGLSINNQAAEEVWTYKFPNRGGRTNYTFVWSDRFNSWFLEGFYTTLQRFRTIHGTKAGMSFAQAQRREHVRWFMGCGAGFEHVRRNPLAIVDIDTDRNRTRVTALEAYGPMPPVTC